MGMFYIQTETLPKNKKNLLYLCNIISTSIIRGDMRIIERHVCAVNSSNLKCDDIHHEIDVIMSVALAGKKRGWRDLYPKLVRAKYENDVQSIRQLTLILWPEFVAGYAKKRRWPENLPHEIIAKNSIEYYLNDICRACKGRGSKVGAGSPQVLSCEPCNVCCGTTKRPIAESVIKKYVQEMVAEIESILLEGTREASARNAWVFGVR